ncbi:MAG: SWI/SNF-related matrix-associated actin-dependent regulator 1 of chromatin subfamily A [Pseudohongiellaceae bacterium]
MEPPEPTEPPELTEPVTGLFVLRSGYEQRALPKDAGLSWHSGHRCRRKDCTLCAHDLLRVWWTNDIIRALKLVEHAKPELRATLAERAGPVAETLDKPDKPDKPDRKTVRAKLARLRERKRTLLASQAHDAELDVPCPEGLAYLPYQRAAIAFGMGRKSALFADEMGLGKTIEALGVVNADQAAQRVLIVCPASLKLNWAREAERWLVDRGPVGVAGKTFPEDAQVVVINYDVLNKWAAKLRRTWDVLIADECHYVKNKDAKRSKRLYALKARRRLFLTGTPILNRPVELWAIVSALAPEEFDDFWPFAKRYCQPIRSRFGWEFKGATHLDELHERLRSTVMVRRTKAQVLPDLPPKRRQVIELDSEHIAGLIAVETQAWADHRERLIELRALRHGNDEPNEAQLAALRADVNVSFGELAKLRQATALAKVPLVIEHVRSVLEDAGKLVLFAHHRAVVAALGSPFGEAAVTLTGGDDIVQRQAAVDRFQEDDSCRLFVGSITAAGFGLTLTAAAHVVFAELDWVPARLTQAEDRTHRIGQKDSVLVQHLVLQDSLDARMVGTLIKKQRVIDKAVDGVAQAKLFDGSFADALLEAEDAHRPDDALEPDDAGGAA